MRKKSRFSRDHLQTLLLGFTALFFVACIILFPDKAFESSLQGLMVWWEVLFPAQLPFFIIAELLKGFGVVHLMGILMEPWMRPLFRVPGSGSFVLAVGLISGNPVGARMTGALREEGLITRAEGERLLAFSSTAGPLFMFGTVAVGFYHDARLGIALACVHYLSTLLVGLLMRYHEPQAESTPPPPPSDAPMLRRAFAAMHQARLEDGRPLGTLMSDAVLNSLRTCLLIGGFIIFFSVLLNMLSQVHLTQLAIHLLSLLPGFSEALAQALVVGLFEITLGARASSLMEGGLALQLAVCGAVMAWGGISIHAQVVGLLSHTDLRYRTFALAKFLQAVMAFVLTLLLWPLLRHYTHFTLLPAFLSAGSPLPFRLWESGWYWSLVSWTILLILLGLAVLHLLLQLFFSRTEGR